MEALYLVSISIVMDFTYIGGVTLLRLDGWQGGGGGTALHSAQSGDFSHYSNFHFKSEKIPFQLNTASRGRQKQRADQPEQEISDWATCPPPDMQAVYDVVWKRWCCR